MGEDHDHEGENGHHGQEDRGPASAGPSRPLSISTTNSSRSSSSSPSRKGKERAAEPDEQVASPKVSLSGGLSNGNAKVRSESGSEDEDVSDEEEEEP